MNGNTLQTRRSIRLPGFDYASAGAYFVTVCSHQRRPMFGTVEGSSIRPSRFGRIVEEAWLDIPNHHPQVALDAFVLMPTHIHGVLTIGTAAQAGAAGRAPTRLALVPAQSGSLSAIVRSFKSASTRHVNLLRNTPGAPLWQRNYYEHVIRNDDDLFAIRQYIADNPAQWSLDEENPDRGMVRKARQTR